MSEHLGHLLEVEARGMDDRDAEDEELDEPSGGCSWPIDMLGRYSSGNEYRICHIGTRRGLFDERKGR